jgi:hypothetical protein
MSPKFKLSSFDFATIMVSIPINKVGIGKIAITGFGLMFNFINVTFPDFIVSPFK